MWHVLANETSHRSSEIISSPIGRASHEQIDRDRAIYFDEQDSHNSSSDLCTKYQGYNYKQWPWWSQVW